MIGFSTTLSHYSLPRYTEVELWFESDNDYVCFVYSSMSSTKLGSFTGIKLSDPILKMIFDKVFHWKFKEIEHIKPTINNSRDFYWIKFSVSFHYLDLVGILEELEAQPEEKNHDKL